MTDAELKAYYADLLILQYRSKPRAYATIQASVDLFIQNQILFAIRDAFDIDTAIGAQLDILGKYAGVSRLVNTFTMGTVALDDDDYRELVRMKFALNTSGSSLADIQQLIFDFFPDALQVFDYKNMRMSYYFDASYGSQILAEAFFLQGLLPKPMGVQLASLMYVADLDNIFAMRTYTLAAPANTVGFNDYDSYATDTTWISYANAIGA